MNIQNDIQNSWNINAAEWIALLNRDGIPSRSVTNKAIVNTVADLAQQHILDVGCGEGWLTRALTQRGFHVYGIDATKALIEEARSNSQNTFTQLTYEEIIKGKKIEGAPFDTIVFNYSLYEHEGTASLLRALASSLTANGKLVIQTVHPNFLDQYGHPPTSRWIENAWEGLDGNFTKPHAWYARTMTDWYKLFNETNYAIEHLHEISSKDGKFVSAIFVVVAV